VPSTVAVGSVLGLSEKFWPTGAATVAHAEDATVTAVQTLMGPELTDKVITPFIHAQPAQPRGGVALSALLSRGGCRAICSCRPRTRSTPSTASATAGPIRSSG
jgi:hypothetical protein